MGPEDEAPHDNVVAIAVPANARLAVMREESIIHDLHYSPIIMPDL